MFTVDVKQQHNNKFFNEVYPSNSASDQGLHCLLTEISMENTVKNILSKLPPETRNGLVQMIRMDKSTG